MNRHTLIVAALAVLTTLPAWATDYTWTGDGEGSNPRTWTEPKNWYPLGVPGANDTAVLGSPQDYAIDLGPNPITVRKLSLLPGAVLASGTLNIEGGSAGPGVLDWSGGEVTCTINIPAGSTLNITGAGEKTLYQSGTINNAGTIVWSEGVLGGSSDGTINNSGTFTITFDGALIYGKEGGTATAIINNTGTFQKTGGTGSLVFKTWNLVNHSVVRVSSGTLALRGGSHVMSDGARFDSGRVELGAGNSDDPEAEGLLEGTVTLTPGTTLELNEGMFLNGAGTFTGGGTVAWTGGRIDGDFGRNIITLDSGMRFEISGSARKMMNQGAVIRTRGTAEWSGSGDVMLAGSTLDNSGTFTVRNDALMTFNAAGTFINSGTFTKEGSTGATTFQDEFDNSGTVVVKSGVLLFDHAGYASYVQSGGVLSLEGGSLVAREGSEADADRQPIELKGGVLQGVGTLDASVNNSGATVSPGGNAIGTLTVSGSYTQGSGAQLLVDVGPSGHDLLKVSGSSTLDGALNVRVQSGFTPAKEDSYQVLASGSREGTFASVSGSTLETRYGSSDVTLGGTGGTGSGDNGGGCSSTPGLAWPLALLLLTLGGVRSGRRTSNSRL